MDYGDILRRTWRITWDNKYLWWLGLFLALGSGGNGLNFGRGFNNLGSFDNTNGFPGNQPPDIAPEALNTLIPIIIALVCVILLLVIGLWLLSVVGRGGLIGGVNHIEDEGHSTFRASWQVGRSNFWRMLGISLVMGIPGLVIFLAALVLIFGVIGVSALAGFPDDPTAALASGGVLALLCLVPLICIAFLASLGLQILRPFADRACVMEGHSVIAAYRRGWDILKENTGNILVLGIIRFFLNLFVNIIVAIPFLILIFGVVFTAILGGNLDAFDQGAIGALAPLLIVAGCVFLILMVIALVVGAVTSTFFSSMWTLAYRQFAAAVPASDEA